MYIITAESFRSKFKNLKTETHKRKINNAVFKDLKLGLTARKAWSLCKRYLTTSSNNHTTMHGSMNVKDI